MKSAASLTVLFAVSSLAGPAVAGDTPSPRPIWHKAPTLSVMTGFIYEPLKPYTIQRWMENLGNKFDANQWVKDFQEVGASHLVFYD